MTQLPRKIQYSSSSSAAIGKSLGSDSVHDKMLKTKKVDTLSDNLRNYKDTFKDNARRGLEEGAAQTIRNTSRRFGASGNTAEDIVNVAKYGKDAKDSLIGLAARGVDFISGNNVASNFVNSILPALNYNDNQLPPAGAGKADPNSILAKMELRSDPHHSFRWLVSMPQLPNLTNFNYDIFNYYVEDINLSLPFFSSEPVFRNGTQIYYPKFSDAGTLGLVLYEDINFTSTNYIQAWNNLIQDRNTGFYNRPSIYKKKIILTPYDSANIPCGIFTIDGAWPSQPQQYTFSSASRTDTTKVAVEFAINRIYFDPYPGRADLVAARAKKPGASSSSPLRTADLQDILAHPLEFAKSALGFKSNSKLPIRF